MKRITLEVFAETVFGSSIGIVGSIFFDLDDRMIFLMGIISAFIMRIYLPKLFNLIENKTNSIKTMRDFRKNDENDSHSKNIIERIKISPFRKYSLILMLIIGFASLAYCTLSTNFKDDELKASSNLIIKTDFGLAGIKLETIKKGEKVIYLDRTWRKFKFVEDNVMLFDFWVKVKTNKGNIGWTYGAYLD